MTEAAIEESLRRYCEGRGFLFLKLRLDSRGWPDRTVIGPGGRLLFLELKQPGGRLSLHQIEWGRRLQALGFAIAICYSADEAKAAIEANIG